VTYLRFEKNSNLLKFLAAHDFNSKQINQLRECLVYCPKKPRSFCLEMPGTINFKEEYLILFNGERTDKWRISARSKTQKVKEMFRNAYPQKAPLSSFNGQDGIPIPRRIQIENTVREVFNTIESNLEILDNQSVDRLVKIIVPAAQETRQRLLKQYLIYIGKQNIDQELKYLWEIGHSKIQGILVNGDTEQDMGWLLLVNNLDLPLPVLAWENTTVFYLIGSNSQFEVYLEAGFTFPDKWSTWAGDNSSSGIRLIYGNNERKTFNKRPQDFKPILHFAEVGKTNGTSANIKLISQTKTPAISVSFGLKKYLPIETHRIEQRIEILNREMNALEHELDLRQPFLLSGRDNSPVALKVFEENDISFHDFIRDSSLPFREMCRYFFLTLSHDEEMQGKHIILPNSPTIFGQQNGTDKAHRFMGWCSGGETLFLEPRWYEAGIMVFVQSNLGIWPPLQLLHNQSDAKKYTRFLFSEDEIERIEKGFLSSGKSWNDIAAENIFILWQDFDPASESRKPFQCTKIPKSEIKLLHDPNQRGDENPAIREINDRILSANLNTVDDNYANQISETLTKTRDQSFNNSRDSLESQAKEHREAVFKRWEELEKAVKDSKKKCEEIEQKRQKLEEELEFLNTVLSSDVKKFVQIIAKIDPKKLKKVINTLINS
jgi:hypothetical protein